VRPREGTTSRGQQSWRGGVPQRHQFQQLQALDDAIAWRRARIEAPCPACEPGPDGRRCDDHACDLDLIADYQQMAHATIQNLPN
jgi:hypothetical protein